LQADVEKCGLVNQDFVSLQAIENPLGLLFSVCKLSENKSMGL
jgi:hypothetical protein